jgi:2,5-diketo-D-gluconate reductase B
MPREDASATHLEIRGVRVPKLGFGTWEITGDACVEAVRDALELGYRHIDTARIYRNEEQVGQGIRDSGVPREDIWLTTKIWRDAAAAPDVRPAAEAALERLGVDRVDLLLLHWPSDVPLAETMGALARVREEGLAREIGVSNFPARLVAEALDHAPVFADQVEFHPFLEQPDLLALCRERDLLFTAYSPFGHGDLLGHPVLAEVAAAYGKTTAQVVLRWLFDQPQVCSVPKAASHANRASNLEVFDFELSDHDRGRIAGLAHAEGRTLDVPWAVWE